MSIVYCSSQAEASERPVVEQVLLADEVRTALLAEEACLLREMDAAEGREGNDGSFDNGIPCIKINMWCTMENDINMKTVVWPHSPVGMTRWWV